MAAKSAASYGMVIFAKDLKRLTAFYQQVLNLKVIESEKSHIVLNGNGLELVIHAIPARVAAGIDITEPPTLRAASAIKPAFYVDDLAEVETAVAATGGTLKPLDGAWEIRGAIVLDGSDPEGNVVQFKQRLV